VARKRMIDPGIWQSEDFGHLSTLAKLVFIGLFSQADDYGRGRGKPQYIKNTLFPYDEEMTAGDIKNAFAEIVTHMSIRFYESNGSEYYALTNWRTWQKVEKPTPSRLPNPDDCEETVRVQIGEESGSVPGKPPPDKKPGPSPNAEKKKYGAYGWVRLSDTEYNRLVSEYGDKTVLHYIKVVDEKAQQTGNKNKWKDWNLTVRNAIKQKWGTSTTNGAASPAGQGASSTRDYDEEF